MGTGLSVTKADGIARIVLNSPPINLFTFDFFLETMQAISDLAVDDEVRVVLISSANPDFFIAGADDHGRVVPGDSWFFKAAT